MAYYLVRARPRQDKLAALRQRLERGEIEQMRPFGMALHQGLMNARLLEDGFAIWEEEDYCRPPLRMERQAVIDDYFTELSVEIVERDQGWTQIEALPPMWTD